MFDTPPRPRGRPTSGSTPDPAPAFGPRQPCHGPVPRPRPRGNDVPASVDSSVVGTYTSEKGGRYEVPGQGDRPRITVRDCEAYGFPAPIGNAAAFNIKEDCETIIVARQQANFENVF